MANEYIFVTTFNLSGYELYGKKMLESFLANWPTNQKIIVYTENFKLDNSLTTSNRVIEIDLLGIVDLVNFKNRHANNLRANGYVNDNKSRDFRFDAVRFSHKVFAICDAVNKNFGKSIIWIDGDTITHTKVPDDFLTKNFPVDNFGVAYLGRIQQYTECGWVVYHTTHNLMNSFCQTFANYYISDEIFNLQEWHDSFVFDVTRKQYEEKGMINQNITPTCIAGHPFINSILGEYMDHMKGPRKLKGRSEKSERRIKDKSIGYWD